MGFHSHRYEELIAKGGELEKLVRTHGQKAEGDDKEENDSDGAEQKKPGKKKESDKDKDTEKGRPEKKGNGKTAF